MKKKLVTRLATGFFMFGMAGASALITVFSPMNSFATQIEFGFTVDDFGELSIDGVLVASQYGYGGESTGILDLSPGWHDINIKYKNEFGSNALVFYEGDGITYGNVVHLTSLRSEDAAGNLINGLTADYFDLSGNFIKRIYGEGPIEHGAMYVGPQLLTYYQGVYPDVWAGIYNGWSTFEERLSGQIFVQSTSAPVPEPATMLLFGTGVAGLAGARLRRKKQ